MISKTIILKTSVNVIPNYNNLGSNGTVGTKVTNCLDVNGQLTGISARVTEAWGSSGGSAAAWAASDYHGLNETFWEWAWISSANNVGELELRGFVPNSTVTLNLAGHSLSTGRNTTFVVNGTNTPTYLNSSTLPPGAPVSITLPTDNSGNITITGTLTNTSWQFNGVAVTYQDKGNILAIDTTAMGEVCTVTTNDPSFVTTNVSLSNDGVTLDVPCTDLGNGNFSFTMPMWVHGELSLAIGNSITIIAQDANDFELTPFTATLNKPLAMSRVTLSSLHAQSVDKIGSFIPAFKNGTDVLWDGTKGTFYADGTYDELVYDGEFWVSSGFEGIVAIWDRDPIDKLARTFNIVMTEKPITVQSLNLATLIANPSTPLIDGRYPLGNRP